MMVDYITKNVAKHTCLNTIQERNNESSEHELMRKDENPIGIPSIQKYIQIVKNNLLPNCPVLRQYIATAERYLDLIRCTGTWTDR